MNLHATATAHAICARTVTKLILPRRQRPLPLKRIAATLALAILGVACANAMAADAVVGATAPYNEAVKIVDGKRVVEVAPFPAAIKSLTGTFKRPDEHPPLAGSYHVVETPQGLMDCLGTPWYHPRACSPSTFGKEKYLREWTVKMHGQWFSCIGQAKPAACIPLLGDGVLRGLPTGVPE